MRGLHGINAAVLLFWLEGLDEHVAEFLKLLGTPDLFRE
jgi:hypothetical protein